MFSGKGGNRFVQNMILGLEVSPLVIILLMMVILIFLGMFMDWIGMALLTMPIFVPNVTGLGYDPVWFGEVFYMKESEGGLIVDIDAKPDDITSEIVRQISKYSQNGKNDEA